MTGRTNITVGIRDSQEPYRQVRCCAIKRARVVRIMATATFNEWLPCVTRTRRSIGSRVQDHVSALAYTIRRRFGIDPPGRVRIDRILGRWSEVRVTERASIDSVSVRGGWATAGILDTDRVVVPQVQFQHRYGGSRHGANRANVAGVHAATRRVDDAVHGLRAVVTAQASKRDRADSRFGAIERRGLEI